MQSEARARIKINKLLEEAGWRFFDDAKSPANIVLENYTKMTRASMDALGEDFEKAHGGFLDFLLLDAMGFPAIVLEAKSEDKDPMIGKEQAREYAQAQKARFILLSNGNLHYLWDLERGNPYIITTFPTPDSIGHLNAYKPNPERLISEEVGVDYIARTQNPAYDKDPRWLDGSARVDYIKEQGLKFLRPYQIQAIKALQAAAKAGDDRYLFEMATGTGKTLIAGAVIKLFLKTGNARRVLFLVDRIELEDQAKRNFIRILKNDFTVQTYKENRDDWRSAEVVVTTVQSLQVDNKYRRIFAPTDYDFIISDEAHRSIGGNSRAVFEYFIGHKLGLTATPKDYLKKMDPSKVSEQDPREWERRLLMDTYKTFGCEQGQPTFRYSLVDGVKDGWLVNPTVADARTEITTQLLSDQGYSVMVLNDEGEEVEKLFTQRDFEHKFFSDETNKVFCETFIKHALRDPLSGEIGKTIVFCVSQNHAATITKLLNELADKAFPGKYRSDFAIQVTSRIPGAQLFTVNFVNNNLLGTTAFLPGYKSGRARACVTVGMMTTGYDCEDILNLCLMRPIFSPTDFIQIKGRGTRKYTFTAELLDEFGARVTRKEEKKQYKLFDFFANCEYFEEKFNYDEVLELPKRGRKGEGPIGPLPPAVPPDYENVEPDPLKTFEVSEVGPDGMKIDRMFFQRFEEKVKADPFVKEQAEKGDLDAIGEHIKENLFGRPEDFFDLEKLRRALHLDRRLTLRELVEKVLGIIPYLKLKDELLEDELAKFVSIHKPESAYIGPIRNFLKAYISDLEIREIVASGEYARLATNAKVTLEDFRALGPWREVIPQYVRDYVTLNMFNS
jgi:type I restriction enzyme R subunit